MLIHAVILKSSCLEIKIFCKLIAVKILRNTQHSS